MLKSLALSSLLLLATCLSNTGVAQDPGSASKTAGLSSVTDSGQSQDSAFSDRYPRYNLRRGDVIELHFQFNPEFDQTVTVQPDGFIELRELGGKYVAGKTVPQLTAELRQSYAAILNQPQIDVLLRDFEKPYFIATGQVTKPGKYELRGDTTVVEALAMAGGMISESAKHSEVVLYRRVSDQWMQGRVLNTKRMLADKNLSEDMMVHPGDLIYVPQNTLSKIKKFIPTPGIGVPIP